MDMDIVDESPIGRTVIKVVGCGGGGSNAVDRMVASRIEGIDFIAVNTDGQALGESLAPKKILLGRQITKGLGAGGDPEVGRQAAEEDVEEIRKSLQGADMVFITAGMGGGTGTGAAPVIARIAMDIGCLTVAIVTLPFHSEKRGKMEAAAQGIARLREHADALITILNENLLKVVKKNTSMVDAFLKGDEVLQTSIQGISDIIMLRGRINIDFADVRSVMKGKGDALMGMGRAKGENKAIEAAKLAIENPLLENPRIDGATGLLVNVIGGEDLSMAEYDEIVSYIGGQSAEGAAVIAGQVTDESLNDEVRVTVIATGFRQSGRDEEKGVSDLRDNEVEKEQENNPPAEKDKQNGKVNYRPNNNKEATFEEWNELNDRGVGSGIPAKNWKPLNQGGNDADTVDLTVPTYWRSPDRKDSR